MSKRRIFRELSSEQIWTALRAGEAHLTDLYERGVFRASFLFELPDLQPRLAEFMRSVEPLEKVDLPAWDDNRHEWYVARVGQWYGPFSIRQLEHHAMTRSARSEPFAYSIVSERKLDLALIPSRDGGDGEDVQDLRVRRRESREPVRLPGILSIGDRSLPIEIIEISERGAILESFAPIAFNSERECKLRVNCGANSMSIDMKIEIHGASEVGHTWRHRALLASGERLSAFSDIKRWIRFRAANATADVTTDVAAEAERRPNARRTGSTG